MEPYCKVLPSNFFVSEPPQICNQKSKNKTTIYHQDVQNTHESMSAELNGLLAERAENHQRIRELEQEIAILTPQKQDIEAELDR